MENNYFLYPVDDFSLEVKRFHICTWEFQNNSSFVEFGIEISEVALAGRRHLEVELYIPWLDASTLFSDFYTKLKEPDNSSFIF